MTNPFSIGNGRTAEFHDNHTNPRFSLSRNGNLYDSLPKNSKTDKMYLFTSAYSKLVLHFRRKSVLRPQECFASLAIVVSTASRLHCAPSCNKVHVQPPQTSERSFCRNNLFVHYPLSCYIFYSAFIDS